MKTKLIQFIPATIALIFIGFNYFSRWCTAAGQICFRTILDQMFQYITSPFYFFALYSLLLTIILIFVPRRTFISWLRFALWAIPLAIIFIALTPVSSNAYMDFFPFYRDDAARLSGEVFSGVSLLLIIWKYFTLRKNT